MTTKTENTVRNQQMILLALALTAAKALARNKIMVLIGLAAVVSAAQLKGAATSEALRRMVATNVAAWRRS
jgi:cell division protein FtsB